MSLPKLTHLASKDDVIALLDSLYTFGRELKFLELKESDSTNYGVWKITQVNLHSNEIYFRSENSKPKRLPPPIFSCLVEKRPKIKFQLKLNRDFSPYIVTALPHEIKILEERFEGRFIFTPKERPACLLSFNFPPSYQSLLPRSFKGIITDFSQRGMGIISPTYTEQQVQLISTCIGVSGQVMIGEIRGKSIPMPISASIRNYTEIKNVEEKKSIMRLGLEFKEGLPEEYLR